MLGLKMLLVGLELDLMWLHAQNKTSLLNGILVMCSYCKEKCIHVSVQSLLSTVHFCCYHSHPVSQDY